MGNRRAAWLAAAARLPLKTFLSTAAVQLTFVLLGATLVAAFAAHVVQVASFGRSAIVRARCGGKGDFAKTGEIFAAGSL